MEEKPQRPNLVFIGKKKDSLVVAGDAGGGASSAASGMGLDFSEKPVSKYQVCYLTRESWILNDNTLLVI